MLGLLTSFFEDAAGGFGDIAFVIRLMSFVYILFWLYITFQQNSTIFSLAAITAGYFIIFHSPIILVLAAVVVLMVNGMFIQQSVQFGLLPLLDTRQHEQMYQQQHDQAVQLELQQKLQQGMQLSEEEMQFLAQHQAQGQMFGGGSGGYDQSAGNMMARRMM